MSAFAVVFERSDQPIDNGILPRVASRLQHRGPDGYDEIVTDRAALGHWHFWTTPEEAGERQPLEVNAFPFTLVFDGRLDNRSELLDRLGLTEQGALLSDAALVLYSYARWGECCVENFLGEFVLVLWDRYLHQLFCARDALGERTLFYGFYGTCIVVASEPWAVAGADGTQPVLNDTTVAHYFAMQATQNGETPFKSVREILPAHALMVTARDERIWRYWQPDPSTRFIAKSDEEYAEQFLALLQESVRCRLRSTTPVGILMSGGLDSTSVACLAAGMLSPNPLTTISYVFDELVDCDERQYIEAVKERWGLRSIQMICDDAWTLKDWDHWPHNPNEHEGNPFRLLKERSYRRARQEGLRVLLTGSFGDELYMAGRDWLFESLADGKPLEAVHELVYCIDRSGWKRLLEAGFLSRAARRFADTLPGGSHLHWPHWGTSSSWQTPFTESALARDQTELELRFHLKAALVNATTAHSETLEVFNASRHSLELRRPYRDRRLIEFVISLPAYQLYSHGFYKYILRVAMKGILPDLIRLRPRQTSLASLYYRGLEREKETLYACPRQPEKAWESFVRVDWLSHHLKIGLGRSTPNAIIPWLCLSYQKWHSAIHSNKEAALQ